MSTTKQKTKESPEKNIISHRKSCDPKGTGLSHYIVVDEQKVKKQ